MSLNKILMLTVFFLALALVFVFRCMYIPERDKNVLQGQKIESMTKALSEVNNALLETSKSKEKVKEAKRNDASVDDWASSDVPVAISDVLQDAYNRARKN